MFKSFISSRRVIAAALAMTAMGLTGCGQDEPALVGASPDMRRLTEEQYANIVTDLFGQYIVVGGRMDPLPKVDGLATVSARSARITPAGFEQYYDIARAVSAQVVNESNRQTLIPCQPKSASTADSACAEQFFSQVGRILYRRPLTPVELQTALKSANEYATTIGDFYEGIAAGLTGMLTTPQFLFVTDTTEPDPTKAGATRLTAFSKAARLSFLIWNTTPDDTLLTAAEKNELHTKDGLRRQVDRMMSSPRMEKGVRAFFSDFLDFQKFENLEKDPVIFPAFSQRVVEDSREQMLRTIADHLIYRGGDYRELFTTRQTFMTSSLARIYQVPAARPDGGWTPFEFPVGDVRAGLATQIGFLAANSHPGKSSPTLRGRAVREVLLCQKVPDPPGDVDFSIFNDPNSSSKTARDRLTAHRTAPACAGCHKITDPIGLGLENFDGGGGFRTTENGTTIDVTGELDGIAYTDATSLGKALHDNPATASCVVNRLTSYALGRSLTKDDKDYIAYLEKEFADAKYGYPNLLHLIATSEGFYAVSQSKGTVGGQSAAANVSPQKENKS